MESKAFEPRTNHPIWERKKNRGSFFDRIATMGYISMFGKRLSGK